MAPGLRDDPPLQELTDPGRSHAPARFFGYRRFTRVGRVVTVAVLALAAIGEIVIRMTEDDRPFIASAFSFATTATFLLFLWRPPIAALALILLGVPGFFVQETGGYLVALAAAFGVVVYSCSVAMSALFAAAILAWLAVFTATSPGAQAGGVLIYVTLAFMSAAIGYVLRRLLDRTATMRHALETQDEMLAAELRAERTRIADELHDIVAHDIAIVAMHARVLELSDDDDERLASQRAIGESAGQALTEARRILHVVHGGSDVANPEPAAPADLRQALTASAEELRALGADVALSLADGPRCARSIEAAVVRMCREGVTNIVKHTAAPRSVAITLTFPRDRVALRMVNSLPPVTKTTLPSSGYGLARLRERADVLGGRFTAGPTDGVWVTEMQLPRD